MDDLSRVNRAMVENVSTERIWQAPSKRKLEDRKQKQQRRRRREKEEEGKGLSTDHRGLILGKELVIYKIKRHSAAKGQEQEGEDKGMKKIDIFI